MRELLKDLCDALATGRPCVHCALVETRGSTPQKAGAAMLVYPDGGQAGTLGGGCVEAEVRKRALHHLSTGAMRAEFLTFNLDDDYGWDDGLICGGRMSVVVQPVAVADARLADYFTRHRELVDSGRGCIEAVVMNPADGLAVGDRFLFDAHRKAIASLAEIQPPEVLMSGLPDLHARPRPSVRSGIAYLPTLPRVRLLIVGGGHVGQAVAKLAAEVEFDVWVVDDREKYVNAERFPTAQSHRVGEIGQILQQLIAEGQITASTYALIVTRGHQHDEEALFHLAPTAAGYVGMIGSKRKIKLIFEDLIVRGLPEELFRTVHAPLGLEIGSRTVPEIAISIVAELIACRNLGATPRQTARSVEKRHA